MKNKDMFIDMLNTLFWSWGGDPAEEVTWAANELLDWVEKEFDCSLGIRFEQDENYELNFNEVIEVIKNL